LHTAAKEGKHRGIEKGGAGRLVGDDVGVEASSVEHLRRGQGAHSFIAIDEIVAQVEYPQQKVQNEQRGESDEHLPRPQFSHSGIISDWRQNDEDRERTSMTARAVICIEQPVGARDCNWIRGTALKFGAPASLPALLSPWHCPTKVGSLNTHIWSLEPRSSYAY